jgi:hypothetical protein
MDRVTERAWRSASATALLEASDKQSLRRLLEASEQVKAAVDFSRLKRLHAELERGRSGILS